MSGSTTVNGQLDADKLDYLLRDSHHVGLQYHLDLLHLISNFRILGVDSSQLTRCELGRTNNTESIVSAEIFLIIWRSMYELVYHVEQSRIAEKMLEKSILLRAEHDASFRENFTNIDQFIELDDERLLDILRSGSNAQSSDIVRSIRENKLYEKITELELNAHTITPSNKFLIELSDNSDTLADEISKRLSTVAFCNLYEIICDIIKSRVPKTVNLESYDDKGEPIELKSKSSVIAATRENIKIKVYCSSDVAKRVKPGFIADSLKSIIGSW